MTPGTYLANVDPWNEHRFAKPCLYDPCDELKRACGAIDSGDETDPEDHEARLQSSWHHRALLGDENRIRYPESEDDDGKKEDAIHADRESDEEHDIIVFSGTRV